jgi:hypothetical protein
MAQIKDESWWTKPTPEAQPQPGQSISNAWLTSPNNPYSANYNAAKPVYSGQGTYQPQPQQPTRPRYNPQPVQPQMFPQQDVYPVAAPSTPPQTQAQTQNAAVYSKLYGTPTPVQQPSYTYSDWYRSSFGSGMSGVQQAQPQPNRAVQVLGRMNAKYGEDPMQWGTPTGPAPVYKDYSRYHIAPTEARMADVNTLGYNQLGPERMPAPPVAGSGNTGGAGGYGGYDGYPGYGGSGGGGGWGDYASSTRWWNNLAVWRI